MITVLHRLNILIQEDFGVGFVSLFIIALVVASTLFVHALLTLGVDDALEARMHPSTPLTSR